MIWQMSQNTITFLVLFIDIEVKKINLPTVAMVTIAKYNDVV